MRKVLFTEAQLKYVLGEDYKYIDNSSDMMGKEVPENGFGTQVFTDNTAVDNDDTDVTTTDNIASKKVAGSRLFRRSSYGAICEDGEGHNVDNDKVNGYGFKSNQFVNNVASNTNREAITNMAKGNQTVNALEVKASRLKDEAEKTNNPVIKRLGNIASKSAKMKRNSNKNLRDSNENVIKTMQQIPDAKRGTGKGNHKENSIYYY